MSLGTFHLMQTLKKSPGALRRRFQRGRTENLSHGDPLFKVYYLGTEKIYSLDMGQACEAISRLLDAAPAQGLGKLAKDHALVVRPRYVEVKEIATGRQLTKTYLKDIAYCAADTEHPNVFLYICRLQGQQLQCRVFWCSRTDRARELTACLADSFQRALSEWHDTAANHMQTEGPEEESSMVPAHLAKGGSLEDEGSGIWQSSESDHEDSEQH